MNWQDERWVKVYTRDSGDILAVGWEGRYVLWELMRKVDRAGILDETDDGVIAEMLRIPHDITERGLARLAKREVIQRTDIGVVIPNFMEAQESKSSNKLRQAEFRARTREKALSVTPAGKSVTKRDETVTKNNAASHGVTPRVDKSRVDKSRQEDNTLSENPDGPAQATPSKPRKSKPKPPPSKNASKAADYLRAQILSSAPNCAAARLGASGLANWGRDLDKLRALSPAHSWPAIRETIDWLHLTENGFVVQSPKALAKKWDAIQANRSKAPGGGGNKPEDPYDRAARIKREQAAS